MFHSDLSPLKNLIQTTSFRHPLQPKFPEISGKEAWPVIAIVSDGPEWLQTPVVAPYWWLQARWEDTACGLQPETTQTLQLLGWCTDVWAKAIQSHWLWLFPNVSHLEYHLQVRYEMHKWTWSRDKEALCVCGSVECLGILRQDSGAEILLCIAWKIKSQAGPVLN